MTEDRRNRRERSKRRIKEGQNDRKKARMEKKKKFGLIVAKWKKKFLWGEVWHTRKKICGGKCGTQAHSHTW